MSQFLFNAGKAAGRAVGHLRGAAKSKASTATPVASGLVDQFGNPISSVAKPTSTTFGDIGQFFKNNALSGFDALKTGIQTFGNTPVKAAAGPAALLTGLGLVSSAIYDKNKENTARMSKEFEPEFWQDWGEYSRREMSNGAEQDDLMPIEDYREQWLANRPKELEQRQDNLANVAHAMYEEENAVPAPAVLPTPTVETTPSKVKTKTASKPVLRSDGTPIAKLDQPSERIPGPGGSSLSWLDNLLPLLLAGGIGYYAGK